MKLNEVCELIVDCPHTTAQDEGSGYALIRTPNIDAGYFNLDGVHRVSKSVYDARNMRAVPQPNDLILAREAPVGNVAIIPEGEQYCLGQRTVLIRPDDKKVNPYFLNYYLNSPKIRHDLTSGANGATVAHLNMPKIRGLEIELPPRPIQDKIATILSNYDMLIANCRKQIALLEEAAQRLYREWFVNFRFPGHESTPIIDALPQDWKKGTVRDCLRIKSGKDHKILKDGHYPVYGSGGIMRYGDKYLYDKPSILIPRKGSLNNILLAEGKFWTIDTMFYTEIVSDEYLYYVYLQIKDWDLYSQNIGAAVPSMNTTILYGKELLFPTENLVVKFNESVKHTFASINLLKKEIADLLESRNMLLPRMMSGEIDVSEISEPVTNCDRSVLANSYVTK